MLMSRLRRQAHSVTQLVFVAQAAEIGAGPCRLLSRMFAPGASLMPVELLRSLSSEPCQHSAAPLAALLRRSPRETARLPDQNRISPRREVSSPSPNKLCKPALGTPAHIRWQIVKQPIMDPIRSASKPLDSHLAGF